MWSPPRGSPPRCCRSATGVTRVRLARLAGRRRGRGRRDACQAGSGGGVAARGVAVAVRCAVGWSRQRATWLGVPGSDGRRGAPSPVPDCASERSDGWSVARAGGEHGRAGVWGSQGSGPGPRRTARSVVAGLAQKPVACSWRRRRSRCREGDRRRSLRGCRGPVRWWRPRPLHGWPSRRRWCTPRGRVSARSERTQGTCRRARPGSCGLHRSRALRRPRARRVLGRCPTVGPGGLGGLAEGQAEPEVGPTAARASCRSSPVLTKCACPTSRFTSAGLSMAMTSRETLA